MKNYISSEELISDLKKSLEKAGLINSETFRLTNDPETLVAEYTKDPERMIINKERDIIMPEWKNMSIKIGDELVSYEELFKKLEELLSAK